MRIRSRYDRLIEDLRRTTQPGQPAPAPARGYLEQVRRNAFAITDRDVAELKDAGLSENEIFELTVAAAVGAGLDRLHAGLRTLE